MISIRFFLPESQTEISEVEQDLKRAQDQKIEVERKLRNIDEEKQALEKVGLHTTWKCTFAVLFSY